MVRIKNFFADLYDTAKRPANGGRSVKWIAQPQGARIAAHSQPTQDVTRASLC